MDESQEFNFCMQENNEKVCSSIGEKLNNDTAALAFISPFVSTQISPSTSIRPLIGIPEEFGVEDAITKIKENNKIKKLFLLINSFGGGATSSYKVARMIRDSFDEIIVFIPHMAASGGTMIALTGDKLIMGEMSALTPTDIQLVVGGGYFSVNTYLRAFKNFTKLFRKESEEDAPYPWKAMAKKLDPLEFQECIDANTFSTKYTESILKHENSSLSERADEIISQLRSGFPLHEYAITIEKAKEIIGEDIVLNFNENEIYLNIWEDMRNWLKLYLMKGSQIHFVRYILPESINSEKKQNNNRKNKKRRL